MLPFKEQSHRWFTGRAQRLRDYLQWFVGEFYPNEDPCIQRNIKVLVASVTWVGPDVKRIAKVLKIPRLEVELLGLRFRNNKIWVYNRVHVEWGFAEEEETPGESWMALLLDAMVGQGLIERST